MDEKSLRDLSGGHCHEESRIEPLPYTRPEVEGDILEQLCMWNKKGVPVFPEMLSQHFDIGGKSMGIYLRQMHEHGYIEKPVSGEEIHLTPFGISEGTEYIYRHNSMSQLLQIIGVRESTADQDACRAEHVFSDESFRAICNYVNYGMHQYEWKIWNSELTERYDEGIYRFRMQMYSMESCRPRKLCLEYQCYSRDIILEITHRGWFELQKVKALNKKVLWYRNSSDSPNETWKRAESGEFGERIPASVFEFTGKPGEPLIDGHLLIAFTGENEKPDFWNSAQLEVQIW